MARKGSKPSSCRRPRRASRSRRWSQFAWPEGVLREIKNDKGEVTARLVNAHELRIETDSVVPCTQVSLGTDTAPGGASVGIRPMRATKLDSTHDVSIHKRTSQGGTLKLDPVTTRF